MASAMQSIPGFHFSFGSTARQKCRARRAQARHPRTFPSPLLPPPYHNAVGIRRAWHPPCSRFPVFISLLALLHGRSAVRGAPKRAIHALFPPLFSLLPTTMQWASVEHGIRHARRAQARQPRTTFSPLLPTLYFPYFWKPTAKCPRTTFSFLLPTLYCNVLNHCNGF